MEFLRFLYFAGQKSADSDDRLLSAMNYYDVKGEAQAVSSLFRSFSILRAFLLRLIIIDTIVRL